MYNMIIWSYTEKSLCTLLFLYGYKYNMITIWLSKYNIVINLSMETAWLCTLLFLHDYKYNMII
jgi:hypothetical protein